MSKIELDMAKDTITKAVSLSEAVQELVAVYASGVADGYRLLKEAGNEQNVCPSQV